MILNDFKCIECDVVKEHRYKYANKNSLVCPECGSGELVMLLSAPALRTLNTRGKVEDALKKRTVQDHNKHKERRREKQKAKHPKLFEG